MEEWTTYSTSEYRVLEESKGIMGASIPVQWAIKVRVTIETRPNEIRWKVFEYDLVGKTIKHNEGLEARWLSHINGLYSDHVNRSQGLPPTREEFFKILENLNEDTKNWTTSIRYYLCEVCSNISLGPSFCRSCGSSKLREAKCECGSLLEPGDRCCGHCGAVVLQIKRRGSIREVLNEAAGRTGRDDKC